MSDEFRVYYERDAGCWMLDAGYWILDTGYWILDTGWLSHWHISELAN